MSKRVRAIVKPDILVWARETAGLDVEIAAKRIGTSVARVMAWEDEDLIDLPTVKQLQNMTKIYRRPLSVFYLQERPYTFQVLRDYRRLPGTGMQRYSPKLLLEQRLINQRREQAIDLATELDSNLLVFQHKANLDETPESVGTRIRKVLGVTLEEQLAWRDPRIAFNAWRKKIESLGIMVFQRNRVQSNEVSGFAICHEIYPVIAINRKATPYSRRSFSLFREFAHLLSRQSGISESDVDAARPPEEQRVEIWCNAVAAATLMPRDAFLENKRVRRHRDEIWSEAEIEYIAQRFSVSREAIVRRLKFLGRTTEAFYSAKRQRYAKEWKNQLEINKGKYIGSNFRVNPVQDVLSNFGSPFVHLVLNSYYEGRITLSDVSSYLNIRVRHIPKIEQRIGFG